MTDEKQMFEVILSEGEKQPDPSKPQASDAGLVSAGANNALEKELRTVETHYDFRELAKRHLSSDKRASVTSMNEAMRAIQGNSVITEFAKQTKLLERNTAVMKFAEQLRSVETSPVFSQIGDSVRLMENSPVLKQISDSARFFEQNLELKSMTLALDELQKRAASAVGPIWELRDAGILSFPMPQMEAIQHAILSTEAHYRVPIPEEFTRLTELLKESPISSLAEQWAKQSESVRLSLQEMTKPWLDVSDQIRSMTGLAEMQGLGLALRSAGGFEEKLSASLRSALGDWRDPITLRPEIFSDFAERSAFYDGLGFNSALTAYPAPAFRRNVEIAGLKKEPPPLIALYGPPIDASDDPVEEQDLVRTNFVQNWLLRLERQLRRFIDEEMTRAFGTDSAKTRLPNGLYDKWMEKKRDAEKNGARELPVIAYADFTDYSLVIFKRDNWREVFEALFGRMEDVRESLQRLQPIRIDAAHARLITQEDQVLLYVETTRLMSVLKKGT
jgi:hypothetical protein